IPTVINESTDQADLDELGSLLQSFISRNLVVLPDVTIVPTPVPSPSGQTSQPTRPDPDRLSVTIRRTVAGVAADADFRRGGETRPVRYQFTGDELTLLTSVLDGLPTVFQQRLAADRASADGQRNQLSELPTKDRQALVAYLRGRSLLGMSDD